MYNPHAVALAWLFVNVPLKVTDFTVEALLNHTSPTWLSALLFLYVPLKLITALLEPPVLNVAMLAYVLAWLLS